MKIKNKIFLSFFGASLVLVLSGLFSFYFIINKDLENIINIYLKSNSDLIADNINTLLNDYKKSAQIFTKSNIDSDFFKSTNYSYEEIQKDLNNLIKDINSIYEIKILDKNGITLISTDISDIGEDKSLSEYFINGKEETYIQDFHYSDELNGPGLDIGVPVFDENNIFVGMVVMDFIPDEIYSHLLENNHLGGWKEVETYIVNRDLVMMSPSLFLEDTPLKQKIDTENSRSCFANFKKDEYVNEKVFDSEKFLIFDNYIGSSVVGTYAYITQVDWCVFFEINEKEALLPLKNLFELFVFGGFIVLVILFFISNIVGKKISDPIKELEKGANIIREGNLDYKVGIDSEDEVGVLSHTFDKMTEELKNNIENIEKKVEERTKQLEEVNKIMTGREIKMIELKKQIEELKNKN